MLIKELGEFGLIDRIKSHLKIEDSQIVGPGDDAAILPLSCGKVLLATTDMLLEDVHFTTTFATPYQIGWKSMASNLSDIAAMGGLPRYALISLGLPPSTHLEFVDELYRGMEELGRQFNLYLVGGDTNSFEKIVISLTVLGEGEAGYVVKRSGARVGDKIVVSGFLGDSGAGLACLKEGLPSDSPPVERLIEKHLEPHPRLREAQGLVKKGVARAMIDLSDGLASDLYQMTKASKVGARVFLDRLPISCELDEVAPRLNLDPVELALYGGEDYELLFTTSSVDDLSELEIPLSVIGEILPPENGVFQVDKEGQESVLPFKGYQHF
jgi:thiamine-monophosphate kinase